jgi:hypothetical protein
VFDLKRYILYLFKSNKCLKHATWRNGHIILGFSSGPSYYWCLQFTLLNWKIYKLFFDQLNLVFFDQLNLVFLYYFNILILKIYIFLKYFKIKNILKNNRNYISKHLKKKNRIVKEKKIWWLKSVFEIIFYLEIY